MEAGITLTKAAIGKRGSSAWLQYVLDSVVCFYRLVS